jgi:hypothetical protein
MAYANVATNSSVVITLEANKGQTNSVAASFNSLLKPAVASDLVKLSDLHIQMVTYVTAYNRVVSNPLSGKLAKSFHRK